MDARLRRCPVCATPTFSLSERCFRHNELVAQRVSRMTPADVTKTTRRLLRASPKHPLARELNKLHHDIATLTEGRALLFAGRRLRAKVARAIATFDCHLALTAHDLTTTALARVARRKGWRNHYPPVALDHLDDIIAAIDPPQVAPFLTGYVYDHVVWEQSRREALARQPIVKVDLGADRYRLQLSATEPEGRGSFLEYEVAPGAWTGLTHRLCVDPELQGLGVATRLHEAMAERHAYVQSWKPATLTDGGDAFWRFLHARDAVLWPAPQDGPGDPASSR